MASLPGDFCGLVGDIGGTNARFAIVRFPDGLPVLEQVMSLPGKNYPSVEAAAQDFLGRVSPGRLHAAVAACAGPVVDRAVSFTNLAWSTTETAFGAAIGLPSVHLINDLAAVAWAAAVLPASGLRRVAHSDSMATPAPQLVRAGRTTRAILNAGTGCNASAFVQNESGDAVVVGEYGHTSFAPVDETEVEIWRYLNGQFGRVSIERLMSGPGLLNIYHALAVIEGAAPSGSSPAEVSEAAAAGEPLAQRAIAQFCATMGSIAGDVALCFGARGGIYLAGGVAGLALSPQYDTIFRQRFEDKARFRTYLSDIPTVLIQDSNCALLGAARAMAALWEKA